MSGSNLLGGLTLLCVALAPGCSSETVEMWPAAPVHWRSDLKPVSSSSPLTPTEKERGLAQAYTTALASAHFVDLAPTLDEEVHFAFGARSTHGRERVVAGHEDMFGAFDQRSFVINRIWLTDSTHPLDSQAFEWTMTGVQARDWMGVAATQKPVVIKGVTLLWTSDAGIITDLHVYFDEELVKAQLGSGPPELQKLPVPSMERGVHKVFERSGAPEETSNAAAARAMIQALEDNNEAAFLSTLADDVELFALDTAEAARGKEAARAYFRTLRRSIRLLDTVVENAWGVRSFVVLEYAIAGLQVEPLRRIPFAANHPLHTQFVEIAEFQNGKIARIWRYADPSSFASTADAPHATRPDAGFSLGHGP